MVSIGSFITIYNFPPTALRKIIKEEIQLMMINSLGPEKDNILTKNCDIKKEIDSMIKDEIKAIVLNRVKEIDIEEVEKNNTIKQFLEYFCIHDEEALIKSGDLFNTYKTFYPEDSISSKQFSQYLIRNGITRKRKAYGRFFNVRLKDIQINHFLESVKNEKFKILTYQNKIFAKDLHNYYLEWCNDIFGSDESNLNLTDFRIYFERLTGFDSKLITINGNKKLGYTLNFVK